MTVEVWSYKSRYAYLIRDGKGQRVAVGGPYPTEAEARAAGESKAATL